MKRQKNEKDVQILQDESRWMRHRSNTLRTAGSHIPIYPKVYLLCALELYTRLAQRCGRVEQCTVRYICLAQQQTTSVERVLPPQATPQHPLQH